MNGDKVIVYLRAWVRLKDSTQWTGGRFADGFVFRNGKITQYLSFGERRNALQWAGIQEQGVIWVLAASGSARAGAASTPDAPGRRRQWKGLILRCRRMHGVATLDQGSRSGAGAPCGGARAAGGAASGPVHQV